MPIFFCSEEKVGDGYCGAPGLILGDEVDAINQVKMLYQKEGKKRWIALGLTYWLVIPRFKGNVLFYMFVIASSC